MVRCDKCGKDVYLPFRCNYCGGYFCEEHRLPEFHDCPNIQRGAGAVNLGDTGMYRPSDTSSPIPGTVVFRGRGIRFSRREVRDLLVSLLLISAIPLTWLGVLLPTEPIIVLGAIGVFAAAFLIHELAHKFSAQRFGYWAEFRMNVFGLLITLVSLFSPLKIVAPGAVVIMGPMFNRDYGKISLAGPVTNVVQAVLYMLVNIASNDPVVWILTNAGVTVNTVLALFNLIPIGVFDGAKIFRWNWRIWLATVAVAGLLFMFTLI
jgi:Zn-dependent protease